MIAFGCRLRTHILIVVVRISVALRNSEAARYVRGEGSCGAYGIRTRDLLNAIEALYQLS